MNLSIVNGYNPSLITETFSVPHRVKEIGYSETFINNAGVMLLVAVV